MIGLFIFIGCIGFLCFIPEIRNKFSNKRMVFLVSFSGIICIISMILSIHEIAEYNTNNFQLVSQAIINNLDDFEYEERYIDLNSFNSKAFFEYEDGVYSYTYNDGRIRRKEYINPKRVLISNNSNGHVRLVNITDIKDSNNQSYPYFLVRGTWMLDTETTNTYEY